MVKGKDVKVLKISEKKVITVRESGTAAIIEGNMVTINQLKWDAKSDFDYDSIYVTKGEILALADSIREMDATTDKGGDVTVEKLIQTLQGMGKDKKVYVGDLTEKCKVENVLKVEEADNGVVIKHLGAWKP